MFSGGSKGKIGKKGLIKYFSRCFADYPFVQKCLKKFFLVKFVNGQLVTRLIFQFVLSSNVDFMKKIDFFKRSPPDLPKRGQWLNKAFEKIFLQLNLSVQYLQRNLQEFVITKFFYLSDVFENGKAAAQKVPQNNCSQFFSRKAILIESF